TIRDRSPFPPPGSGLRGSYAQGLLSVTVEVGAQEVEAELEREDDDVGRCGLQPPVPRQHDDRPDVPEFLLLSPGPRLGFPPVTAADLGRDRNNGVQV